MLRDEQHLLVEDKLRVLTAPTGVPIYDFDFRTFFSCRVERDPSRDVETIARIGAFGDYDSTFSRLLGEGIRLIHSPEQHIRCSQLTGWYPLIQDLTPRSRWFSRAPNAKLIKEEFGWPVFVKGARQTSRHRRSTSIIPNADHFDKAMSEYEQDSILGWQPIVVREFVPLRAVEDTDPSRIPSSFEFRTFWCRGRFVGGGRYWWEGKNYRWTDVERTEAIALGAEVARRVDVAFLVVDMAMTREGRWIVIECNDGQESGYVGATPLAVWQNILNDP